MKSKKKTKKKKKMTLIKNYNSNWRPKMALAIVFLLFALSASSVQFFSGASTSLPNSRNLQQTVTQTVSSPAPQPPTADSGNFPPKPLQVLNNDAEQVTPAPPGPEPQSIHLALVSARGALAFWRPGDELALWSPGSKQPAAVPASHSAGPAPKCPQRARLLARPAPANIIAVEGASSLKLNFVIVGLGGGSQRFGSSAPQSGASPAGQSPAARLKLQWTKNGEPLPGKSKLSQQLINEDDLMRQHLRITTGRAPNTTSSSARPADNLDLFMLAPFVDEQFLELGPSNSAQINQADLKALSELLASSNRLAPFLSDDFLADYGQSIDWQKLEDYLRNSKHFNWDFNPGSDCDRTEPQTSFEQLTIVRAEVNHISLEDRGFYQLNVCQKHTNNNQQHCKQIAFKLQVLEDVPKFESKFEHLILEPGDRLSIKCEATGFTLPQITWFLDGQQLNEQQHSQIINLPNFQELHGIQISANSRANSNQQQQQLHKLRIGDYVTQDNHVHSFVNSTSVQVNEAGSYKCLANNGFHSVEHEARVDVRGPPTIARPLSNASVLVGQSQFHLQCPFSGYPIGAIEWFHKPATLAVATTSGLTASYQRFDYYSNGGLNHQRRAKRWPAPSEQSADTFLDATAAAAAAPPSSSELDADKEPDPERDEWLSQASAMTPPTPEEYPDPLPDYPSSSVQEQQLIPSSYYDYPTSVDLWSASSASSSSDYSDVQMDLQQRLRTTTDRRRKREANSPEQLWIKFPQGRRHQIQPNGTLVIQEVNRNDQGFYKCRVLASDQKHLSSSDLYPAANSNELFLTVLVPPVISPFASLESLREGMRNLLTCSVIEGDPPFKLRWFKDNQPIEEYILKESLSETSDLSNEQRFQEMFSSEDSQAHATRKRDRIRVEETSNEYTSTLYFSHVDFKDNGNYTCMWEIGVYSAAQGMQETAHQSQQHLKKDSATLAQQHPNHYRTIISNSRIHILENASLVIRDVNKLDQGFYLCQAANNFGSLSSLIKLTVNVGAAFSNKYLTKYVKLNEKIELDCDPIGQSPVDVIWYMRPMSAITNQLNHTAANALLKANQQSARNANQSLSGPAQMLFMPQDTMRGQQQHKVTPQTGIGSSTAATAAANIESLGRRLFVGSIQTDLHHSKMGLQNLQPLEGATSASPYSPPSSNEEGGLNVVDSTMSFEIISRFEVGGSEFVRFSIKQAKRFHSADYICRASNRFGSDEKLIKLLVQEPPDSVQEMSVVQLESRTISISWPAPFNGNSPITSYTVEWAPTSSEPTAGGSGATKWAHTLVQQPSATISSLEPMTTYEIRIRAHNLFGQAPISALDTPLFATTSEEAPTAPPSDIRALGLSSNSLQLSWLAPAASEQQPKRRYSIRGYYLGYKVLGSNDSYVFKTVSLFDVAPSNEKLGGELLPLAGEMGPAPTRTNSTATPDNQPRLRVIIGDLKRATKYAIIVQAYNSAGPGPQSDAVEVKTLLNDPPPAPLLRVGMVTYSSIEIQWSFHADDSRTSLESSPKETSAVDGYYLYYRSADNSWLEKKLSPETHTFIAGSSQQLSIVELTSLANSVSDNKQYAANSWSNKNNTNSSNQKSFRFILDQLACGTSYQMYLIAYNSIGSGLPSQIVRTKTRGSPPISPRKQDYLLVNSTFVKLNFDAWMDGGCSITNFEIRYKQVSGSSRAADTTQSQSQSQAQIATNELLAAQNNAKWSLLSANISPEQRMIELRDLQPETWYSVLTTAESIAGKTEASFTFMTLDRFGLLPAEAIEPSTLPALFRNVAGNGSIRSILYNFSSANNQLSPMIFSVSICLLLFASCSLFLVKRYNNMMKDGGSLNSQTTSNAISSAHLYHADQSDSHAALESVGSSKQLAYGSQEYYSMKGSPCKTSATLLTAFSGAANSSSCAANNQSAETYQSSPDIQLQAAQQFNQQNVAEGNQQHFQRNDQFCDKCDSPARFATLARDNHLNLIDCSQQHSLMSQHNRFKTLPHNAINNSRPISTFLPNGQYQVNNNSARFACQQQQQLQNDFIQQQQLQDPQQIYSKLRLIYNSNSNYNLCNENLKSVEQNNNQQLLFNDNDAINLAVLTQQNPAKLLAACNTLKRASNIYTQNNCNNNNLNQFSPEQNAAELTSILNECQQQQQLVNLTATGAYNHQYHNNNQAAIDENPLQQASNNFNAHNSYDIAPSIASNSTNNTTSSTQQTLSCSLTNSSNNSDQQHLLKMNADVTNINSPVCAKKLEPNQQLNKSQQTNNNGQQQPATNNNEQSDYALPFPPKWV